MPISNNGAVSHRDAGRVPNVEARARNVQTREPQSTADSQRVMLDAQDHQSWYTMHHETGDDTAAW
jgi:hypothetical protein